MATMTSLSAPIRIAPLLLAALLAGCEQIATPEEGREESELNFVEIGKGVELERDSVSFWAYPDRATQVEIRYVSAGVYLNGNTKCLLFRVPAGSLLRHPNGRRVEPGDSVRITIGVANDRQYNFRFQPSGLRFNPGAPAQLEIRYRWANPDFNSDGVVDARDAEAAAEISVWHQSAPGERWFEVPTLRIADGVEARTAVFGFSQYALATDRSSRPVENGR